MISCSFFLTINSIFTSIHGKIISTYEFALSFFSNKISQDMDDDQLTLYFTSLSYSLSADTMIKKSFRFPSSSKLLFFHGQILHSLPTDVITIILIFLFSLETELLFYKDDMAVKNGRSSM